MSLKAIQIKRNIQQSSSVLFKSQLRKENGLIVKLKKRACEVTTEISTHDFIEVFAYLNTLN